MANLSVSQCPFSVLFTRPPHATIPICASGAATFQRVSLGSFLPCSICTGICHVHGLLLTLLCVAYQLDKHYARVYTLYRV